MTAEQQRMILVWWLSRMVLGTAVLLVFAQAIPEEFNNRTDFVALAVGFLVRLLGYGIGSFASRGIYASFKD